MAKNFSGVANYPIVGLYLTKKLDLYVIVKAVKKSKNHKSHFYEAILWSNRKMATAPCGFNFFRFSRFVVNPYAKFFSLSHVTQKFWSKARPTEQHTSSRSAKIEGGSFVYSRTFVRNFSPGGTIQDTLLKRVIFVCQSWILLLVSKIPGGFVPPPSN